MFYRKARFSRFSLVPQGAYSMNFPKYKFIAFILLFFIKINAVHADYISLIKADQCESIVEYFIDEDGIRLTLEIGPNDFQYFREIVPKELGGQLLQESKENNLRIFCNQVFPIAVKGKSLQGKFVKTELKERIRRSSLYTGKVDEKVKLSKYIWFVEIFYPLHFKPQKIQLTPEKYLHQRNNPANIGVVAYHQGIPINDLRFLSAGLSVNLDWNDPWYSKFKDRNYLRHHSSSLMSYLYVEPYEVRHEIVIRVKDLEGWVSMNYKAGKVIPVKDLKQLKKEIANFISSKNILVMDGQKLNPIIDRVHFLQVSLSGIQILDDTEAMPYNSAIVGVILSYPNKGIPQNISINWDMFNTRIQKVPTVATDPAGPMPGYITPDNSQFVWNNYLKTYKLPTIVKIEVYNTKVSYRLLVILFSFIIYLIAIVALKKRWKELSFGFIVMIVSVFVVTKNNPKSFTVPGLKKTQFAVQEAKPLVHQILKNIYRAFDYKEESKVYDMLSVSVEGDLLTEMYIQTKKSMVLENQGGLEVKIDDIEIIEIVENKEALSKNEYRCKWLVKGEVGHWGHKHMRHNLYHANIKLEPIDNVWKLTDIEVLQEERIL